MSKVPPERKEEVVGVTNYLCHHFVQNDSAVYTKLRVVYDASNLTTTGVSLNDTMLVGATLQDTLYDLLLRFRVHPVVLKGDIAKMFRQFKLNADDANLHRILWRETPNQQVEEYTLNTVTYGTACAPNLATRCIQQLGKDCAQQYPLASAALLQSTYVDDILAGSSSPGGALALYRELTAAVATAGLELRKWTSNSPEVLEAIPEASRETQSLVLDDDNDVKALGVQWHPASDNFKFKTIEFDNSQRTTMRSLLSDLSRLFDPLGLISCVTLRGKLIFQELWKCPGTWDSEVPTSVEENWKNYKADLHHLVKLEIPRCITVLGAEQLEIHAFGDSSEAGLGGIVYLRSIMPNGSVEVRFVTSKSKVAPVRQVTLPRLELCAAVLIADLVVHVKECLQIDADIRLWSDSTITLTWIKASPRRWKTFVANRVATIQELTLIDAWDHVAGTENPADLASRGCTVEDLCQSKLWWSGPDWLSKPELPKFPVPAAENQDMEERAVVVAHAKVGSEHKFLLRFSSLNRLKRTMAWIFRFWMHKVGRQIAASELSAMEMKTALHFIIRKVQRLFFYAELNCLEKGKPVGSSSRLQCLHPFIDKEGLLRVTGRIQKAGIPGECKHQIIIPGGSHLSLLLMDYFYNQTFHGGFQITWSSIQMEYWMLHGRSRVRHFVRKCVKCRRHRARAATQLMGSLPAPRVTPSRPFSHTGVDYAGPFMLKDFVGRVPKVYKGYLCLFVCLASKAVYLEPASALTTGAFLAAFRRFTARRGLAVHVYTDNGTNFVGADRELQNFVKGRELDGAMSQELGNRGVAWHFNPPSAPHVGGLWEAAVKSAKHHLKRVTGSYAMTFEQFSTFLAQVEAILNSRPLYTISADPGDVQPLTPGHFLVGGPLIAAPDENLTDIKVNRLSQFQRIQQQQQLFWRRWSREYLNTLQQRNKWAWEEDNVKTGDLVLLVEETPPATWKMGRITEVHPGDDGKVRRVTVKTATSVYDRVIAKLVPLLNDDI